jgi:predicted enzyme related to lactoylglutathione lyase
MNAKLVFCNVPTRDFKKASAFYGALLGEDNFARSLTDRMHAYHQPISPDGTQLTLSDRQRPDEPIICTFAVDNLADALQQLRALGATLVVGPVDLPIAAAVLSDYQSQALQHHPEAGAAGPSTGSWALIRDPDGNAIGLCELQPHAQATFKHGKYRQPLPLDMLQQHARAVQLGRRLP